MDDDIFLNLSVIDAKKTYTKKEPQPKRILGTHKDMEVEKIEPLTTKVAVKYLLEGTLKSKVCRYCLNITPGLGLSELDQIMKIAGTGTLYKVTIRDIIASFHPFKVIDDPNFPNKICQKCLDRALGAYLFTQQCERAERAMLNCFDDMYEKLEKLDPIDRPKKRGRQKLNPNYNTLHAEYYKVIDYADPIINIVNIGAEMATKEPELNDLECKKCWQILPNLESLIKHEKTHPKTMWYNCRLCGKSFPKRNQLKKHNHRVHVLGKEVHSQHKDFKCNKCNHVTDNYIQHLQHVEKHRFKNIMEHVIEKRTDNLCVICFNNSTKMTNLDEIVCIHGGHPDLMGDKTLYSILASTLPDKKSYKYQELYVPSKAQIMTISKKRSYDEVKPVTMDNKTNDNFVFSYPIVVSKNHFKTDHFYYYVFDDPNCKETETCDYIDINANEIDKLSPKTELVEMDDNQNEILLTNEEYMRYKYLSDRPSTSKANVIESIDIHDTDDEPNKKKSKNGSKTLKKLRRGMKNYENAIERSLFSKIIGLEDDIEQEPITKKSKILNTQDSILHNILSDSILNFSNIKRTDLVTQKLIITEDELMNPDPTKTDNNNLINTKDIYETEGSLKAKNVEDIILEEEKTAKECDLKRLTKESHEQWIFKNTLDESQPYNNLIKADINKTADCKFCWVFKHAELCNYCKKPINKIKNIPVKEKKPQISLKEKIWQCNACLTNNNTDRQTCHCCGAPRHTQQTDIRITFGNKTFFHIKNKDEDQIAEETNPVNLMPAPIEVAPQTMTEVIEEPLMMDFIQSPEETKSTIVNINMQTMDIQTNIIQNKPKDFEDMDVEENPIVLSKGLDWTQSPMFNFNIGNDKAANIGPNIGTNITFNIGLAADPKPGRKFKRAIRNMSKASHK